MTDPPQLESPWFRVGTDEVRHLRDGVAAFPAMLGAISSAKREVLLEFYWIAPDLIGRRFRDALVERALGGARVRVIYDSLGSRGMTREWWQPLLEAGGDVREYHAILPFSDTFRLDRLVQRDHRKLLVVDGAIGFMGGINIGNEWCAPDAGGGGWRDDAIAVRGEAPLEMRALFYRTWRRITHQRPPADVLPLARRRGRAVYVLASQRRRRRSIHSEYLVRIAGARRSIDLAHAYFVPDRRIRQQLFRAAARGVRVRVLIPAVSDVPGVQFAIEAMFDALLEHGVEIYTLPPPMLHSKTAIVDGRFVTIGSYNLDEGLRKNLEANIAVLDDAFARHVGAWFEHDIARATQIDHVVWQKRSLTRRGAQWLALALRELW